MARYYYPKDKALHDADCAAFYAEREQPAAPIQERSIIMSPYFRLFAVALVLIGMGLACTARAESVNLYPDAVGVHLGSVHSNSRDEVSGRNWNNANPGVYFRWGNVAVGTYYNSIRKESFYVGYVYPVTDYLDVTVGVISGYNGPGYAAKPIMPMVVPSVHFPIGDSGLRGRIHVAPKVAKGGATAVHFSLEWRL